MKTLLTISALLCGFQMPSVQAASQTLKLDTEKSSVKWSGTFMKTPLTASLKFKSGELVLQKHTIRSGTITADMKSISSDSGLDDQFKGEWLLNTEKYPTAVFKVKAFTELHSITPDGPNARVKGTLMFHGKTHEVEGDFVMTPDGNGFHAVGKFPTTYSKMVDGEASFDIFVK